MKQVKLLKTTQIPDENHQGSAPPATATNYAGAILDLGSDLADELIAAGAAELYIAPHPDADAPVGETAEAVARTFGGQE